MMVGPFRESGKMYVKFTRLLNELDEKFVVREKPDPGETCC
jgi:hypothetical protein